MGNNSSTTELPSSCITTSVSANMIVDRIDTTISNGDKVVVNDTDDLSNEEKTFYLKVDDYKTGLKYLKFGHFS